MEGPLFLTLAPPQTVVAIARPPALLAGDVEIDALVSPTLIILFRRYFRCLENVTGTLGCLHSRRARLGRNNGTTAFVLSWVRFEATTHRGFTVNPGALCQIDGLPF